MKESNSRREFLSQSGKMVTAAALFGAVAPVAYAANPVGNTCGSKSTMTINDKHYYLDNVLLEAGFDYENSVVVHTRIALQTVEIQTEKSLRCARISSIRMRRCRTTMRVES